MTKIMNLHGLLKTELGLEVPIYRGNGGSLEDPYIIDSDGTTASKDYVSLEYLVIKSLCKLHGYEWRLVRQQLNKRNGKSIDSMEIEVRYVDEEFGTYKTESQTYFFDITNCLNHHQPHKPEPEKNTRKSPTESMGHTKTRSHFDSSFVGLAKNDNSFKKKIIKTALVLIILMGLFPPWSYVFKSTGIYTVKPASYSFLLTPPEPEQVDSVRHGIQLDLSRLFLQWLLVALAAGTVVYIRSDINN